MKLQTRTGLIVLLLMLVGFVASAQNVTGKWNRQSTKTILKEIEAQTGLSIFYRSDEVDENAVFTGEFSNTPVEKALQTILGKDIAVSIDGKMIVLSLLFWAANEVTVYSYQMPFYFRWLVFAVISAVVLWKMLPQLKIIWLNIRRKKKRV